MTTQTISLEVACALLKDAVTYVGSTAYSPELTRNIHQFLAQAAARSAAPETLAVKPSLVHYGNYMATLSESLLSTIDKVDQLAQDREEADIDDAELNARLAADYDTALETRSEYQRALRSAVYEYRRRLPMSTAAVLPVAA
jgi:hypothetical protein